MIPCDIFWEVSLSRTNLGVVIQVITEWMESSSSNVVIGCNELGFLVVISKR